jgi:hypothetical protein
MDRLRKCALDTLKERRPFPVGSPDWQYRTRAAWTMLQIAMGKPANKRTHTPPPVTVRG